MLNFIFCVTDDCESPNSYPNGKSSFILTNTIILRPCLEDALASKISFVIRVFIRCIILDP